MPEQRPANSTSIETVAFVSLGCPKNLVDSEKMLGLLAEAGVVPISDETRADAIVVNTCGFLEAARDEALDEIARVAKLKTTGSCRRLVVAGCLVQRHGQKMLEWCPQIDGRRMVTGVNWSPGIVNPFRQLGRCGDSLDTVLQQQRCGRDEPIILVLHMACPRVEYTDRGKSAVVISE